MLWIFSFLGVIILFAIFVYKHQDCVKEYFFRAALIYVLMGEEDCRLASLAAAKVAASPLRDKMMEGLLAFLSNKRIKGFILSSGDKNVTVRIESLYEEISSKEWSIKDIAEAKISLDKINRDYDNALLVGNFRIFGDKYNILKRKLNSYEE